MMENNPSDIVDFRSPGCIGREGRGQPPVIVYGNDTWPADDEWCLGQERMVSGDRGWAQRLIAMEMGTWL